MADQTASTQQATQGMANQVTAKFEELDHDERHRRIAEGVQVVPDDWQEQEEKRERIKREVAELHAIYGPKTIKRADFDKLGNHERYEHVRSGGVVID